MKRKLLSLITVIVLAFSLSACEVTPADGNVSGSVQKYDVTVQNSTSTPTYGSLVEMLDAVRPSVVEIYTQSEIAQGTGAGSGIVLSVTGTNTTDNFLDDYFFVLTCHHVIDGGDRFLVKDIDGNNYSARLIGGDPDSDIAVLCLHPASDGYKINQVNLAVATRRSIESTAPLKVGEEVVAIGNPLGTLGGTVTKGIISSVERVVEVADIGDMTLIQTDCSINGGNSGGGLFDTQGNLLGVVNAGYTGLQGLNFAIPINDAFEIYEGLMETYFYSASTVYNYGYIKGKAKACAEHNLKLSFGSEIAIADYSYDFRYYPASVRAVKEGSVYETAGFQIDDMIRSITHKNSIFHATNVSTAVDLVEFLNDLDLTIGDTVTFTVLRKNGATKTLTVTYEQFIYGDTGYHLSNG